MASQPEICVGYFISSMRTNNYLKVFIFRDFPFKKQIFDRNNVDNNNDNDNANDKKLDEMTQVTLLNGGECTKAVVGLHHLHQWFHWPSGYVCLRSSMQNN